MHDAAFCTVFADMYMYIQIRLSLLSYLFIWTLPTLTHHVQPVVSIRTYAGVPFIGMMQL